jgi:transcriptional regulator with XRE-family HTH domain
MTKPVPLAVVLGRGLKAARERAGRRQEDIAAAAREEGFDWTRGAYSMIEGGRRRLTLEELFALPTILFAAGVSVTTLGDLVGDEAVALSVLAGIQAHDLKSGLAGIGHADLVRVEAGRDSLALQARGDTEMKAARALGVTPLAVATAAQRLWKRSVTAERDRRIQQEALRHHSLPLQPKRSPDGSMVQRFRVDIPARILQAKRGHVTRQLLVELRPVLTDLTKRKRRPR